MHYMDKSFCRLAGCKKFATCPDAFTEQVAADAQKWWGNAEAPIMFIGGTPSCFDSMYGTPGGNVEPSDSFGVISGDTHE